MRNKYKNISEEETEKMKKYKKNYREKMKTIFQKKRKKKMREYKKNYREKRKLQLSDSLSDSLKRPSSADEVISKSSSIYLNIFFFFLIYLHSSKNTCG